jgi:hypothetical protein
MDATRGRRQRRFIAALLSLHTPGIGQMAIGHWRRGAVFLGAALVAWGAAIAGIITGHLFAFWIVVALGMANHLASMVDTFFLDPLGRPLGEDQPAGPLRFPALGPGVAVRRRPAPIPGG